MFSTNVRGRKALSVEQKIKEMIKITGIFRIKNLSKRDKIRVKPKDIIHKATNCTNKTPCEKYEIEPNREKPIV